MRRFTYLIVLFALVAILAIVGCSSNSDKTDDLSTPAEQSTPTTTIESTPDLSGGSTAIPTTNTGTPNNGIAVGEPAPGFSPISLPTRTITFRANVPENTPDDEPVFLTIMDMTFGVDQRVEMKRLGNSTFEAKADVRDSAMIRYTYDRFEYTDVCCLEEQTRESLGESFRLQYRFLLTQVDVTEINDSIPMWADLRVPYEEGQISGFVFDSTTGEPVLDADVSISGVHVGSRTDGSFHVPRLPAGEHTVVVHSNTGDFNSVQKTVTLDSGGEVSLELRVTPTNLVPVTFDVLLPDSTPKGAWVKLAGNLHALGGRIGHPGRANSPDNFFIPKLERDGNRAHTEIMLPTGAFIEYFYTIGPLGVSDEKKSPGTFVRRSFIVGSDGDKRSDNVERWSNDGWPLVTIRLIPPEGTPANAPIALNMGPSSWMEPAADGTYTTVLGTAPSGGTYTYRYLLGDDFDGSDGSDAAIDGVRTLIVPENGGEIVDVVTRWTGQGDPTARRDDGSLAVKFRLSVPPETPLDSQIFLVGDRPALGNGVELVARAENPWLYEGEIVFGHDGTLNYSYELRSEGSGSSKRSIFTQFDGQTVNDWIVEWPGLTRSVDERDDFVKGIFTPDFYSNGFIALSDSTYQRARAHEASAVVVSSVWSYGQTQPIPTLEYRSVHAGTVSTPLEDAIAQAQIAHDAGLDVFFGPQFNMEQAPGGFEVYNGSKTDEWWVEWLKLADEMWTWQATVAEMIEAEYMMLPGPLFHVYDQIDRSDDHPTIKLIESEHVRIIAKVRSIYSGKIVITGGADRYEFPGLADYNGVTTYDIGVPSLPADTTVAEFVEYYEERFTERVDPVGERWGNPVFLYTIHTPAMPTADDPAGEIGQANALEALFQVISTRPEITASLSWSYRMIDTPLTPNDGIRGRLGEAVLAKWYAILGGEN